MIENADRYLDAFVDAGATWISLHVEALPHLQRAVAHLKSRGREGGRGPEPRRRRWRSLEEILPELDYVLVMSVNPGFGGQRFIPASLDKIRRLRAQIRRRGLPTRIEVDGGVDAGQRTRRSWPGGRRDPGGRQRRVRPGRSRGGGAPAARGRAVERRSPSTLRVRYAETDQMGVAWHGAVLRLVRGRAAPTCCATAAAPTASWRARACACPSSRPAPATSARRSTTTCSRSARA